MGILDSAAAACLIPLAIFILVSGMDDLVLDVAMLCHWLSQRFRKIAGQPLPRSDSPHQGSEKRIAVFVPLWREDRVIARMLEHNLAAIRYEKYDFFVGLYPNDTPTLDAARTIEARFSNVHLAVCPHDGPTSKGDCLNWIYQHMLVYEEQNGTRFELVITHDAEDLIHPEELKWINYYSAHYDMVQIPVLPLPTPFFNFTHGVYCDEFAEYQTKDVPLRQALGGFIPSNGVGTGYSRRAIEKLAQTASNRVFEPACLTEDYENGFRLHLMGFRQLFVPIQVLDGNPVATREYFPARFRQAVEQRTRWVIGISLQGWERHGWGDNLASIYWFWRDRKGLLGNPISLTGNLIFLYGLITWLWSQATGKAWGFATLTFRPELKWAVMVTVGFLLLRITIRAGCVNRIYGWRFALGVPPRMNWINSLATLEACSRYLLSRVGHKPLLWLKTEHLYPSRQALMQHKRKLGEILVARQYLSQEELETALVSKPVRVRLGDYLVQSSKLTEEELYKALNLQQNLPAEEIDVGKVRREAAHALPARLVRKWRILPLKVTDGCMFLAGPELPPEALEQQLRQFTSLEIRFQLVTPGKFELLQKELF
jgi:adsorption protein B